MFQGGSRASAFTFSTPNIRDISEKNSTTKSKKKGEEKVLS
jgi:hypothetical protein